MPEPTKCRPNPTGADSADSADFDDTGGDGFPDSPIVRALLDDRDRRAVPSGMADRHLAALAATTRAHQPTRRWRRRVGIAAAGVLLVVGFTAGLVGPAASDALPGDLLYPVKLTGEQTGLLVAGRHGPDVRLSIASARVDEFRRLVEIGRWPLVPDARRAAHSAIRAAAVAVSTHPGPQRAWQLAQARASEEATWELVVQRAPTAVVAAATDPRR